MLGPRSIIKFHQLSYILQVIIRSQCIIPRVFLKNYFACKFHISVLGPYDNHTLNLPDEDNHLQISNSKGGRNLKYYLVSITKHPRRKWRIESIAKQELTEMKKEKGRKVLNKRFHLYLCVHFCSWNENGGLWWPVSTDSEPVNTL